MVERSDVVTRVKILNQTYDICGSDPEHVRRLAEYVDDKMREAAALTPTVDTAKVAILAALNIAEEYHAVRGSLDGLEAQVIDMGNRIRHGLARMTQTGSPVPRK